MEIGDLLHLLAGFVAQDEPLPPDTVRVALSYKTIYEYDDRPTMSLGEDSEEVTIRINNESFPQKIPLFEFERGTIKFRFGRAKLDSSIRRSDLINPVTPTIHRMLINRSNTEIPILFFNVVTETDKYTGQRSTFADFYVL